MVSCSDFRHEYSDFRDGATTPTRRAELLAHRTSCDACARHDRSVDFGVEELVGSGFVTPSDDFLQRLQHRIYNVDEERAFWSRPNLSGTSAGFVLMLVVLIAGAAWVPVLRRDHAPITLAPVAALAPVKAPAVPALFQTGPLLDARTAGASNGASPRLLDTRTALLSSRAPQTIFYRYMPVAGSGRGQATPARLASVTEPRAQIAPTAPPAPPAAPRILGHPAGEPPATTPYPADVPLPTERDPAAER